MTNEILRPNSWNASLERVLNMIVLLYTLQCYSIRIRIYIFTWKISPELSLDNFWKPEIWIPRRFLCWVPNCCFRKEHFLTNVVIYTLVSLDQIWVISGFALRIVQLVLPMFLKNLLGDWLVNKKSFSENYFFSQACLSREKWSIWINLFH